MRRILPYIMLMPLLLGACSTTIATRDVVLSCYLPDSAVRQLLYVEQVDSSQALASFYIKESGAWRLEFETTANIGRNGLGKEKEGDMLTPIGEYGIGVAFGILPNPGTRLPYIEVTDSWYACEDEEYYNQLIDTAEVHHECHGEHLIACAPDYNYSITTTYNAECVPGQGSNIFLHCKGHKPYTAGCVALDEEMMRRILMVCDSHMIISIHKAE